MRAVNLFVESVQTQRFHALGCTSQLQVTLGTCSTQPGAWFGGEPSNWGTAPRGIFSFPTNSNAPFAQGGPRP